MFRRFRRMIRSFIGMFISMAENPELILQQNIQDMNDQVPQMNNSIAMVRANVTLLEKEETQYKAELQRLVSNVQASIQAKREDLAGQFAVQLEQVRSALARNQGQLGMARSAFEKAQVVKKAFMAEKERKTQQAMLAIQESRRAVWQGRVADAMEQFQVAGVSQTHDEMLVKVQQQTALNEARMDMALDNVDQQKLKIEEEAEKLRAADLVKQFKERMGLALPAATPAEPLRLLESPKAKKENA